MIIFMQKRSVNLNYRPQSPESREGADEHSHSTAATEDVNHRMPCQDTHPFKLLTYPIFNSHILRVMSHMFQQVISPSFSEKKGFEKLKRRSERLGKENCQRRRESMQGFRDSSKGNPMPKRTRKAIL